MSARAGPIWMVLALLLTPTMAQAKLNVYVSNSDSSNVSAFDIAADGSLVPMGAPIAAGNQPLAVTATPDGNYLYVGHSDGANVFAYAIAADGSLAPVAGSPFPSGSQTHGVAVSPDGRHLFAASGDTNTVAVFAIADDGSLAPVAGSPFAAGPGPAGVAVSGDGRHLYVANNGNSRISAFTIAADGSLAPVAGSPFVTGTNPQSVTIAPNGQYLYVGNLTSSDVSAFTIAGDGSLTPVPGSAFPAGTTPAGLAITPDGAHLYATNTDSSNVSGYTVSADGSLTPVPGSPFPAGALPQAATVTPSGANLYVSNANGAVSAYAIAADGALTPVSGSPFPTGGSDPGAWSVAITPNQPPVASFTAPPPSIPVYSGERITFFATGSTDSDGTVARYDWDFGDGTRLPNGGPNPTHRFVGRGTVNVELTVTDDAGCSTTIIYTGQTASCNGSSVATETKPVRLVAGPKPLIFIDTPAPGAIYRRGRSVAADYRCAAQLPIEISCTGTVADGQLLDTATIGPHTLTVTATDEGLNQAETTVVYEVRRPRPVIKRLAVVPTALTANTGRTGSAKREARIEITLSQDAKVRFRVRHDPPQETGGRAPTNPHLFKRRLRKGESAVPFMAILDDWTLKSGEYRLIARARNSADQVSRRAIAKFRIKG